MMSNFGIIVNVRPPIRAIDTTTLFDENHEDTSISPVDQFLDNCTPLNRHWSSLREDQEVEPELGRLLLVGYASAVEGYMRSLIRKLVHNDPYTQLKCSAMQLSFAAALHHQRPMLPDALLEEISFSTQKVIAPTLTKYVGIPSLSNGTKKLLDEFDLILQLRHCCTHRFGKLGVKNATELGLNSHRNFLEKPVNVNKIALDSIADLTFSMVKSINNDVFTFVLTRSATEKLAGNTKPGIGWTWNKARDRKDFKIYYDIFCSKRDATPSPAAESIYELFRNQYRKVGTTQPN
jgi:hypothetical protein